MLIFAAMSERPEYIDLRKSYRISITEGIFAQISGTLGGAGSVFLTKFAVLLGATPFQFGVLGAIGQLSQIFQPVGVVLTRRKSERKPITLWLLTLGRLMVVPFGFLPFIFPNNIAIWFFLGLFMLGSSFGAVGVNTWIAWFSDLVPLRIRGRFLSRRSQYLMVAGIATGYLFGAFLDIFDSEPGFIALWMKGFLTFPKTLPENAIKYALMLIFLLSAIAGIISIMILRKQPERPKDVEHESISELLITPLRDKNFRRLMVYGLWWMAAIGIGAPFWQPFMIGHLKMSVVMIQIYATISVLSGISTLRLWGIFIDKFGNKTAMRFAIVLGCINPLIWLFATPSTYWIIYFEAAFSGIMWSGANIVALNFVLAIAPPKRRQVYSGVYGAFSGVAMMTTMLLSGAFLPRAMEIGGLHLEPEQVLFGLTGIARLTAEIPLTWIKEPRSVSFRDTLLQATSFAKVQIASLARFFNGGQK